MDKTYYQAVSQQEAASFLSLPHDTVSWVEISRNNLVHNIRELTKITGNGKLGCVVKGNAYGHGLEAMGTLLDTMPDVAILLVVSVKEALQLRDSGVTKPILVMGYHDASLVTAIEQGVHLCAYSMTSLTRIIDAARIAGCTALVHIKVDTGMSRLGVLPGEVANAVRAIRENSAVDLVGVMTHFGDSNNPDNSHMSQQVRIFDAVLDEIENMCGQLPPYVHANASGGLARVPNDRYTLHRVGTNMYGYFKCDQQARWYEECYGVNVQLKPIMTWKTKIIQLKDIPTGRFVGYDCAYHAEHDMRIAILPIGYADGYSYCINKGFVLVRGVRVPVLGRVSMNMIIIDVTHVPAVQEGDNVVIIGDSFGMTADDIAKMTGTINLYTLTRINPTFPRVII